MFGQIGVVKESRHRRWSLFLSIGYLMIAAVNGVRFWYLRDADHAINGCLWLTLAIAWAYKSKHIADPQITKLEINALKEKSDA